MRPSSHSLYGRVFLALLLLTSMTRRTQPQPGCGTAGCWFCLHYGTRGEQAEDGIAYAEKVKWHHSLPSSLRQSKYRSSGSERTAKCQHRIPRTSSENGRQVSCHRCEARTPTAPATAPATVLVLVKFSKKRSRDSRTTFISCPLHF